MEKDMGGKAGQIQDTPVAHDKKIPYTSTRTGFSGHDIAFSDQLPPVCDRFGNVPLFS